jgi:plastocyanin
MRLPRRRWLIAVPLGFAAVMTFAVMSFAAGPTIQPSGTTAWSPNTATITTAESVTFKNPSTTVPHGVRWTSSPATPNCSGGVPVESNGTNWEGTCSFAQAGTYSFMCTVHAAMTGTITVTSSGPEAPAVATSEGTPTSDTEATLKGTVNPHGQETEYFFNYGTDTSYGATTSKQSAGEGTSAETRTAPVTGLLPGTTYHFQIVAKNATGESKGADKTFTTSGPPTPTTNAATAVGAFTATLQGSVSPGGHETTYYFEWGTDIGYGETTPVKTTPAGTSPVSDSVELSGLAQQTEYHFRLVAENPSSAGLVLGTDRSFTTSAANPPVPTTSAANPIGSTTATLQGSVNPGGLETTYFFEWGTDTTYGKKTTVNTTPAGTAGVPTAFALSGLTPATTYHFRLVAENALSSGPVKSADRSFETTASAPPPPPPTEEETKPPATPPPTPPPTTPSPAPEGGKTALDTKITSKPGAKTKDRTPTFKFKSTAGGAAFKCTLDGKALKPCRSPLTTKKLSYGRHTLMVTAVAGGQSDPTPAAFSFKVVQP